MLLGCHEMLMLTDQPIANIANRADTYITKARI